MYITCVHETRDKHVLLEEHVPVYLRHDVFLHVEHGASLLPLVHRKRLQDDTVEAELGQDTGVVAGDQGAGRVTLVLPYTDMVGWDVYTVNWAT